MNSVIILASPVSFLNFKYYDNNIIGSINYQKTTIFSVKNILSTVVRFGPNQKFFPNRLKTWTLF